MQASIDRCVDLHAMYIGVQRQICDSLGGGWHKQVLPRFFRINMPITCAHDPCPILLPRSYIYSILSNERALPNRRRFPRSQPSVFGNIRVLHSRAGQAADIPWLEMARTPDQGELCRMLLRADVSTRLWDTSRSDLRLLSRSLLPHPLLIPRRNRAQRLKANGVRAG